MVVSNGEHFGAAEIKTDPDVFQGNFRELIE
jgi:hypothetical protein